MIKVREVKRVMAGDVSPVAMFFTGTLPISSKYKKVNQARLGVSRLIYVNVDSPNLGFIYFNFLGGYQFKMYVSYSF